MPLFDQNRQYRLVAIYLTLALGWAVFAFWIAPPFVVSQSPGRLWSAFLHFLQPSPALFIERDLPHWWPQFSFAVLIAAPLHLSIALLLRYYDSQPTAAPTTPESQRERRISLVLLLLSFLFLALTVLYGPFHDYYFYLQMWYEVRAGHDPWFLVPSKDGLGPLNAYGPLFNPLALLAWVNPLAPKLLFAYAYILFAITHIKRFGASRLTSPRDLVVLLALFWNPYPWIEIAMDGHFDIIVALLCLASVRLWIRQYNAASALTLAAGVLMKFMPIAILPFMAMDRSKVRGRFVFVAVATIAVGFSVSFLIWGISTFAPIRFAASRPSRDLSIFVFLRTGNSPLTYLFGPDNYDEFSPHCMALAMFVAWYWYVRAHPSIEVAAIVAVMTMVLFHRTGYPQYHMVPSAMAASWLVRHSRNLAGRPGCVVAIASYFLWIVGYEVYYHLLSAGLLNYRWHALRPIVGVPSFLTGYALIFGLAGAERPKKSVASSLMPNG